MADLNFFEGDRNLNDLKLFIKTLQEAVDYMENNAKPTREEALELAKAFDDSDLPSVLAQNESEITDDEFIKIADAVGELPVSILAAGHKIELDSPNFTPEELKEFEKNKYQRKNRKK